MAICKRSDSGSGFAFVETINFYNTQISRGFNGNPAAFELVNHEKGTDCLPANLPAKLTGCSLGRVSRTVFETNSTSQCEMWCRDIEIELRRAMLAQFNRPGMTHWV